ncbi:MAG: MBL fold metallo-hydrolase [Alphaproteobacteria bacterium]|nr:MAG: MBL fold metallo-hydrolase [Alphaproteobacteria bacterium]
MIFRQIFDFESCTYTYLLASRRGGEALIIDSVLGKVDHYLRLLRELDLRLVKTVDTHVHADHITGMGALRDRTRCITVMGEQSGVDVVSMRVGDGDRIDIEGLSLTALHTPGHTDDSYCFLMDDRVFTGDTLLIRGTGRTDFQNGDPVAQYHSLFDKLLKLPDETLVYPGHDYKGDTVSTIAEERAFNPRLQVRSVEDYVELMNNLDLPNPKMMDVAVPANLHIGLPQDEVAGRDCALDCDEFKVLLGRSEVAVIDLRDKAERHRYGEIPGSLHVPYTELDEHVAPGGLLHELATATGKRLIFYCAYGERSALAVQTARERGLRDVCHLIGGLDAWIRVGGPVTGGDTQRGQEL